MYYILLSLSKPLKSSSAQYSPLKSAPFAYKIFDRHKLPKSPPVAVAAAVVAAVAVVRKKSIFISVPSSAIWNIFLVFFVHPVPRLLNKKMLINHGFLPQPVLE